MTDTKNKADIKNMTITKITQNTKITENTKTTENTENTTNTKKLKTEERGINTANLTNTVGIGIQDFLKLRENHNFYIDKTSFIKEWWESGDDVTLITRPRRFGKTLNMSMMEEFFSVDYADRGDLFEGLYI